MRNNTSFVRKIVYVGIMALLLVPLSALSRPATRESSEKQSPGGWLAKIRSDHGLAQADLGEIDPASESMKLATLGMRGIAANILWTKANHYKKTEDWDNLRASLNQITKLQPNFVSVWIFQGWNMAFNVSVEFDDFRSRYHWVKKGIDFLIEGTQYNHENPRLLKELGWSFQQKIGRSDEKVQFRELFRNDEDFHRDLQGYLDINDTYGPDHKPDNWLVAAQWYRKAQSAIDNQAAMLTGESPLVFNSHFPMALIRFAEAIEGDGIFDEMAQAAWQRANRAWIEFGERDIPHSQGFRLRLNDGEKSQQDLKRLLAEYETLLPGVRDQIRQERWEKLTDEERRIFELYQKDSTALNEQEHITLSQVEEKLAVGHDEVASRAPAEKKGEAARQLAKLEETVALERATRQYRNTVNFEYWRRRCEAEKTQDAIDARRDLFESEKAFADADLEKAKAGYERSWDAWARVFDAFPALMDDITADDLMESIRRYRDVLKQLDEPFPPPGFKLLELVKMHNDEFELLSTTAPDGNAAPATESDDAPEPAAEPAPAEDVPAEEVPAAAPQPADAQPAPVGSEPETPAETSSVPATDVDDVTPAPPAPESSGN